MSFKAGTKFFRWPSVLLLTATLLFSFIPAGSVTAQTGDDHGDDSQHCNQSLALGSSLAGRIDPGSDRDIFGLDLSRAAGPNPRLDIHHWRPGHPGLACTAAKATS